MEFSPPVYAQNILETSDQTYPDIFVEPRDSGIEVFTWPNDPPGLQHIVGSPTLVVLGEGEGAWVHLLGKRKRLSQTAVGLMPPGMVYRITAPATKPVLLSSLRVRTRAFAHNQAIDRLANQLMTQLCELARKSGGVLPLRRDDGREAKAIIAGCGRLLGRPFLLKAEVLRLFDLLEQAVPSAATEESISVQTPMIRELIKQVSSRPGDSWSVSRAMEVTGLGRSSFHTAFRQATHTTFKQYLSLSRIEEAARLIRQTNRTILDISLETGYPSLSQFHYSFKRQMGCPPGWYRRSLRP